MSTSATQLRDPAGTAEGRGFRPDFRAPADRLALLVELIGGDLPAPGGDLLWLCDGLCRDAAPREQETSDERRGLAGDRR